MTGHNVPLPMHRYVHVDRATVLTDATSGTIPAIWFGVAVQHGRAPTAHVLLENSAIVHDLPWRALAWRPDALAVTARDVIGWDAYGDAAELVTFQILADLGVHVLTREHDAWLMHATGTGLALDYVGNGYALEPAQTKVHHVVYLANGRIGLFPQDRLLWRDASFTVADGIPPIRRQTTYDTVEG